MPVKVDSARIRTLFPHNFSLKKDLEPQPDSRHQPSNAINVNSGSNLKLIVVNEETGGAKEQMVI